MTLPIAYQPGHMAVQLFNQEQFITPHDWTHDRHGNLNPVLHARFSAEDGEFDGYAKPFNWADQDETTVILNEVTGWLIARAAGLPCPPRAFFIQIPATALPAYSGKVQLPGSDTNGMLLCFVTEAVANTAVKGMFDTAQLVKEQSEWKYCDSTIAFDEGVANSDRHAFNLLRKSANDFVLIDHGFLLREPSAPYPAYWADEVIETQTTQAFDNRLHANTYIHLGRTAPDVAAYGCSKSVEFSATLRKATHQAFFEIAFWCSKLLPGSSARWLHFLHHRMEPSLLDALLSRRYGMLHLNAIAST